MSEILCTARPNGGGADNYGAVFSFNTLDYSYNVVYSFTGSPDGQNPYAGLTLVGNTLYGTTQYGGADNYGAVFSFNTIDYSYNVVYSFTGSPDGQYPVAGLTLVGNTLYGTTNGGGADNYGAVFSFNTIDYSYNVVYSFNALPDGQYPYAGLTLVGNTLYGTTNGGGADNYGAVFSFNTIDYSYNVVYSFNALPDGQYPLRASPSSEILCTARP